MIGASGALGFGVAIRLARSGVPIAIGSRETKRAQHTVQRAQAIIPDGRFSAHDNADAVRAAGTVILSVPFRNQAETLINISGALSPGQLLIDASVPLAEPSIMPFSMAGRNCCGTEPPKILPTNSKPLPRGNGSKTHLQSPNWPRPPVCFLCRPCTSTLALMVSL